MLPSLVPLLLHLPDPSVQLSVTPIYQLFPPDLPVPARDQKGRVWGGLVWREGLCRGLVWRLLRGRAALTSTMRS